MKVIDKELAISLGKRIRYFRKERKFSQEKLAVVSGLHRTYIGGCERGEKNITVQTVSKLSSALGVTLDEFFSCDSLNNKSGKA